MPRKKRTSPIVALSLPSAEGAGYPDVDPVAEAATPGEELLHPTIPAEPEIEPPVEAPPVLIVEAPHGGDEVPAVTGETHDEKETSPWILPTSVETLEGAVPMPKLPKTPPAQGNVQADGKFGVQVQAGQDVVITWTNPQGTVIGQTEVDAESVNQDLRGGPPVLTQQVAMQLLEAMPDPRIKEQLMRSVQEDNNLPATVIMGVLHQWCTQGHEVQAGLDASLDDVKVGAPELFANNPNAGTYGNRPVGMAQCSFCYVTFRPDKSGQACCDNWCGKLWNGDSVYPEAEHERRQRRMQYIQDHPGAEDASQRPPADVRGSNNNMPDIVPQGQAVMDGPGRMPAGAMKTQMAARSPMGGGIIGYAGDGSPIYAAPPQNTPMPQTNERTYAMGGKSSVGFGH
jgi:hypothetical protein